ncbi:hypothetical protein HAX54_000556 [Datura stramonium]|uniref:Uncharacterized protein n=1 Tax=Datura stramonium TaxID=4076 RepID=A0ABS8T177_DATST|nr:hypothetical protein [Datura stramonium]
MTRLPLSSHLNRSPRRHSRHVPRRLSRTPPPPPPIILQIFNTVLLFPNHRPQSWVEMGLVGHTLPFTFELNNQEMVFNNQNSSQLAQIVSEGMRLGVDSFDNHNLYTQSNYTMMEPSFNYNWNNYPMPGVPPMPPVYHPQTPGAGGLIFPWIQSQNPEVNHTVPVIQPPTYAPPPLQQPAPPADQAEQIDEEDIPLPSMAVQNGIRPKVYVLNSIKNFMIQEEYNKKHILKCPVRLNKCIMDIRLVTNPNSKSFAVSLIPTLVPVNHPVQTDSASSSCAAADDDGDEEPPKMTLMIWNCRGSEQDDFRTSYRSMLDYHRPALVLLLETHMTNHQYLADDFEFTDIANVPATGGNSGGMALVWKNDLVTVDGVMINNEKVHCTIKVVNPPAE